MGGRVNNLTLEQCKKLKELGFPQESFTFYLQSDGKGAYLLKCLLPGSFYDRTHTCYVCPTLEELIEWLGEDFHELIRSKENNSIWWNSEGQRGPSEDKATPLEAVYNMAVSIMTNPTQEENMHEKMLLLVKGHDWTELAEEFQKADIQWHADEWKRFIQEITENLLREFAEDIKKTKQVIGQLGDFDMLPFGGKVETIFGIRKESIDEVLKRYIGEERK